MIEAHKSRKNESTKSEQVNKTRQTKRSAFEMLAVGYEASRRMERNPVAEETSWSPASGH